MRRYWTRSWRSASQAAEAAGAARGQRKMSGYKLWPRDPQPTAWINFTAVIRILK